MSGTISFSPGGAENTSTAVTGLVTGLPLDYTLPAVDGVQQVEEMVLMDYTLPAAKPDLALDYWDLNFTLTELTLHLLNDADASTLDVTKITVQNAATSTVEYTLVDSTTLSADGDTIIISLGVLDLAALTGTPGLATNSGNSWLRIASGAILDLSANSIATLSDGHARQVTTYTP